MQTIETKIKNLLNKIDKSYFIEHPEEVILKQLYNLLNGSHFIELLKPAQVGDGIIKIDHSQENSLYEIYDKARLSGRIIKFIPASGASTRMFTKLISALDKYSGFNPDQVISNSQSDADAAYLEYLIKNLENFAFFEDISSGFKNSENPIELLKQIISPEGLGYNKKPKALLKFHKYINQSRSAFIEHLIESTLYQADNNNNISFHFTISENHLNLFKEEEKTIHTYDQLKEFNFNISYSFQKTSTDSITLNDDNELYLNSEGKPLFRPAGHGALLENLNDLKADIVFIKNIDNVCIDSLKPLTAKYQKLLGGLLILFQKQIFEYLILLENKMDDEDKRSEIIKFSEKLLNIKKPDGYLKWKAEQQREFLFKKLNRPIRVCGVVKNQGETGGGPFWVKNQNGDISLQIIEHTQINFVDQKQKLIFNNSNYFNPVNIVAGLRDYRGRNFDLINFRDEKSYMVVNKLIGSERIKSLELPGLWNGGMSDWISILVEVPLEIFNPVKELTDLLKKGHIEKLN